MFKKARLYSLLAIIVASTAVGLLGSSTSFAQQTEDTIQFTVDGHTGELSYGDKAYTVAQRNSLEGIEGFNDLGIPAGSLIFARYDVDRKNDERSSVTYFIYVTNPSESCGVVDGSDKTRACDVSAIKFLTVDQGRKDPATGQADNSFFNPRALSEADDIAAEAEAGVQNPPETVEEEEGAVSYCDINGIGWLVCPLVNFLANVIDASYWMLEHTFLRLEPLALPGANPENGVQLHSSWKMMRDIANICFIIGFLIIVFSQLTSFGVSNYGVKRLLPKIIVAAILVNLSYYICVIAVDLSNILGNSLRGLIESGITNRDTPLNIEYMPDEGKPGDEETISSWFDLSNALFSGTFMPSGLSAVVGGLAAGGIIFVFLPVFIPMVLTAALAIGAVILVLSLRQALIVMLVVVSPLAFVALLLPNTESWFQKWRSLFVSMLLVYPAISVVFGASQLASQILMNTGDFPTQMIGAGVSVIPLAITPLVMKVSGGLLNRWVGLVNNPAKGPLDSMKKGVEGKAARLDDRRKITSLRGGGGRFVGGRYRRRAKSDAIDAGVKAEAGRETNQYVAREIQENDDFRKSVAGSGDKATMDRALANAKFTVEKAELEEVKAASVLVEGLNFNELAAQVNSGTTSSAQKAAALDRMITIGDPGDYEGYINKYGSRTNEDESIIRRTMQESLAKNGPQFLKGSDLDAIGNGQMGAAQIDPMTGKQKLNDDGTVKTNASSLAEIARANPEVLGQAKMAASTIGELEYAYKNAAPEGKKMLSKTAQELENNPSQIAQAKHNRSKIQEIANMDRPAPDPASMPIYGPPVPWDLQSPQEKATNPDDI